tara:strand:+ start:1730 stop:2422 length:693 start_codon:yes stop_codon:yes gene_type:complete
MNIVKLSVKIKIKKWLTTTFISVLIRMIGITTRVSQVNKKFYNSALQKHGSVIFVTWHQNIFFSIWLLRKKELTALISSSEDGEIISKVFKKYGFAAVRGSSSRGGIPALKQLINLLKKGKSVAITPDGPLGPPKKIQSGVILLAKYTNLPIIPWHYEPNKQWELKSWDKHKIPKPFTSIVETYGEPFYVPKNLLPEDVPFFCQKLENILKDLNKKSIEQISLKNKSSKN